MIYLVVGFIGALLMFCGDMLLYYDPNDFNYKAGDNSETKINAIIEVMGKVSPKRLYAGGFIGPVAAFLYCVGFYHIVFISNENVKGIAIAAFLLSCLGIIAGGAYHSHCAYLGLLAKDKYREARNTVMRYFQKMILVVYIAEGIGFVLLAGIIVTGNSILPRWAVLTSPMFLMLLKPLVVRLPKGVRVIVSGGWSNLISVIYYAVAIGCTMCIL